MHAHFAEKRRDGQPVREHVARIEPGQKRGSAVGAADRQGRLERAAHRHAETSHIVHQLRQPVRRGVHADVERVGGAQTERSRRIRRELGRRERGAVDHDATPHGVNRRLGRVQRQRADRSAVDARRAAHVDVGEPAVNRRVAECAPRYGNALHSKCRHPKRQIEIFDGCGEIEARAHEGREQRGGGHQRNRAVCTQHALASADGQLSDDNVARARPVGLRVADRQVSIAESAHVDVPARRDAGIARGRGEPYAAVAVERIARIEKIVEVGEIRPRCTDVDGVVVRPRDGTKAGRRRSDEHDAVPNGHAGRIGRQRCAPVDERQSVHFRRRHADRRR